VGCKGIQARKLKPKLKHLGSAQSQGIVENKLLTSFELLLHCHELFTIMHLTFAPYTRCILRERAVKVRTRL